MISIRDSQTMEFALSCPLDPFLKQLLLKRLDMLSEFSEFDLSELVNFYILEPGDTVEAIEAALNFSPWVNFVDGARFPDAAFTFSWEWLIAHGPWFELMFALSDSGFGVVLLVPNRPDVEPSLLSLLNAYSTQPSDTAGK